MSVTSLADYTGDSRHTSPEQLLHDALGRLEPGGEWDGVEKLLVIALDDDDGNYGTSAMQCGMKYSEVVALLEIAKHPYLLGRGFGLLG